MGMWNVKYKENSTFHLDDCFESTVKEGSEDMKMKRIVSLAIATMLVLGSVNVVFADISEPMRIGENRQLNVPLDYQRTKYTCGPACMKMLLAKFGKSVSESQLAKEVHTQYNEVGTIVGNIPPVLNKYLGGTPYKYYYTYSTNFTDKVLNNIRAGYPVICHVKPDKLPNYKGKTAPKGHYVVIKGYIVQAGSSTQISVTYNDPHYETKYKNQYYYGTYNVPIATMNECIEGNASLYIAH